jgi:hypothetical protein
LKPLHNFFYIFYVHLSIILLAVAPQGARQRIEPGTFGIEAGELTTPQPNLAMSHNREQSPIILTLKEPKIRSKESIPPAYVAWRAGTTTLFLLDS